jgi:hypothetical protein
MTSKLPGTSCENGYHTERSRTPTLSREALLAHGRESFHRLRTQGETPHTARASHAAGTHNGLGTMLDSAGNGGHGSDETLDIALTRPPTTASVPASAGDGADLERARIKLRVLGESMMVLSARNEELETQAVRMRRQLDGREEQAALVDSLRATLDALASTSEADATHTQLREALAQNDALRDGQAAMQAELELTRGALHSASEQLAEARAQLSAWAESSARGGGAPGLTAAGASEAQGEAPIVPSDALILQRWESFTRTPDAAGNGADVYDDEYEDEAEADEEQSARRGSPSLVAPGLATARAHDASSLPAASGAGAIKFDLDRQMDAHHLNGRAVERERAQTPPTMARLPSPLLAASDTPAPLSLAATHDAPTIEPAADELVAAPVKASVVAPPTLAPAPARVPAGTASDDDVARLERLLTVIMSKHNDALSETGSLSRAAEQARTQLELVGIGSDAVEPDQPPMLPPHLGRKLAGERAAMRPRTGWFASLLGFGEESDDDE